MEECKYLSEKEMESLGKVIFCSLDNTPFYRKCCPPKDKDEFFVCFEEFGLCEILENFKNNPSILY